MKWYDFLKPAFHKMQNAEYTPNMENINVAIEVKKKLIKLCEDGFYGVVTAEQDSFKTGVNVIVTLGETDMFEVAPNNYGLFNDIVDSTAGISIVVHTNGVTTLSFLIENCFVCNES